MHPSLRKFRGEAGLEPWLFLAVAVLAFAVVAWVAAVTVAACGTEGGASTVVPPDRNSPTPPPGTETAAPPPSPSPADTPTRSPTATPTADNPGPGQPGPVPDYVDDSTEVPCTIDAPLDMNHRVSRDCVIGPLVNVEGFLLNADAAEAYAAMRDAAAEDGITLFIVSAYRSFETQWQLYWAEVSNYGPDQNTSAKPGHSEHQLGTTVDLNELSEAFGDSPAGQWLQQNAHRFGFRMSYPRGNEQGYAYEPWHWRWWGD